jgi:Raf kinase inhibitor-like YbhB/YbcL family protein
VKLLKAAAMTIIAASACATILATTPASARALKVKVDSIRNGGTLATKYAFCAPAAQGHTTAGQNINPRISWSKGPRGTKSYAIILFDPKSPAEHRDMMNKEGMTLTADVKRHNFYHWILVDIPPNVTSIKEGADSNARVAHGKPASPSAAGLKGLNDYTKVTAANEAMKGKYYGYDGPCPPWNDDLVHDYHFTVYALSVKSLGLPKDFDAAAAQEAMKGKILAQGELVGNYTQNPAKGAKPGK